MGESLPRRWPWLTFAVLPVVCIAAVSLALAAILYKLSEMQLGTDPFVQKVFFLVRGLLIWAAPVALSAIFACVAYRSRLPLRWPLLTAGLVCALSAMINVDLALNPPGAEPGGSLSMGLGTGPEAWPTQLPRLLLTAALVIIPLVWATRKRQRAGGQDAGAGSPRA
jgi:hypothetical protein